MPGPMLLFLFAAGVLACTTYWTRRDRLLLRWTTRLALIGVLMALLLPAEAIGQISAWIWSLFPGFEESPTEQVGSGAGHVVMFTVIGFLFGRLRPVIGWPALAVFLIALVVLTEALQHLSPGRHPSLLDVGFNTTGVVLGLGLLRYHEYLRLNLCLLRSLCEQFLDEFPQGVFLTRIEQARDGWRACPHETGYRLVRRNISFQTASAAVGCVENLDRAQSLQS